MDRSMAAVPHATHSVLACAPLRVLSAVLKSVNDSWHRSHVMTELYRCLCLVESSETSHWQAVEARSPYLLLPEEENTNVVKEPCLTFLIRYS